MVGIVSGKVMRLELGSDHEIVVETELRDVSEKKKKSILLYGLGN